MTFSSSETRLPDEWARKNAEMADFDKNVVGEKGLEPLLDCSNKILSLARLPVPPLAQHIIYSEVKLPTLPLYHIFIPAEA